MNVIQPLFAAFLLVVFLYAFLNSDGAFTTLGGLK